MIYDKLLTIYNLTNTAGQGLMPVEQLVEYTAAYYGERTIGVTRQYAALGADKSIDVLVRIWRDDAVVPGQYVILEDDNQYRIDIVQHTTDEDNLAVSDLTLVRLEDNYDVAAG